jgi:hypothetical protein
VWIAVLPVFALFTSNCGSAGVAWATWPPAFAVPTIFFITVPWVVPCGVLHCTASPGFTVAIFALLVLASSPKTGGKRSAHGVSIRGGDALAVVAPIGDGRRRRLHRQHQLLHRRFECSVAQTIL